MRDDRWGARPRSLLALSLAGALAAGQMIPFAKTRAERQAAGDPRLSVEERYPSFAAYEAAVRKAVEELVRQRLMLREDAEPAVARLTRAGQATAAIRAAAN